MIQMTTKELHECQVEERENPINVLTSLCQDFCIDFFELFVDGKVTSLWTEDMDIEIVD